MEKRKKSQTTCDIIVRWIKLRAFCRFTANSKCKLSHNGREHSLTLPASNLGAVHLTARKATQTLTKTIFVKVPIMGIWSQLI